MKSSRRVRAETSAETRRACMHRSRGRPHDLEFLRFSTIFKATNALSLRTWRMPAECRGPGESAATSAATVGEVLVPLRQHSVASRPYSLALHSSPGPVCIQLCLHHAPFSGLGQRWSRVGGISVSRRAHCCAVAEEKRSRRKNMRHRAKTLRILSTNLLALRILLLLVAPRAGNVLVLLLREAQRLVAVLVFAALDDRV